MDGEAQLVICLVVDLILAEGDVADGQIVEVPPVGGFKSSYGDVRLGVELLGNASADGVQFHTIQTAVSHFLRQHTEEVAHAAGRFQDVAGLKAQAVDCLVDGTDHRGAGVVGIQCGASGCGVFLRGQSGLQRLVLLRPGSFVRIKGVGQAAPANVAGEDFLLLRGGASSLGLNGLEGLNGLQVGAELGLGAAFAQMVVGDSEVPRRRFFCRLFGAFYVQPFHHYIKGKVVFLCWIYSHGFGGKAGFLCCNSFRIRHNLLDKGVLIQLFLVCHLTVHNAPLRQRLPDQGAVQIQHRVGKGNTGIGHGNAARPAGEVLLQLGIFLGVLLAEIPFAVDEMPQQLVRLFPGKERCGLVGVSPEVDALAVVVYEAVAAIPKGIAVAADAIFLFQKVHGLFDCGVVLVEGIDPQAAILD